MRPHTPHIEHIIVAILYIYIHGILRKTVLFTCSSLQILQYCEQSDLAFMLLIKSQNLDEPLNLDELMRYSLFPVPPSLGTADGFFNKTNKAAMLHYLMEDAPEDVPYPKDAFYIQDGNALFHALMNLPLRRLRSILSSQRTPTMMILSRLRRDCVVACPSGTS